MRIALPESATRLACLIRWERRWVNFQACGRSKKMDAVAGVHANPTCRSTSAQFGEGGLDRFKIWQVLGGRGLLAVLDDAVLVHHERGPGGG